MVFGDASGPCTPHRLYKPLYLGAGARPNFMKIASIVRALEARRDAFDYRIVHTGQHCDRE